ncbi:unnamed protein product, partial [Meganyctiphanes norvegica]
VVSLWQYGREGTTIPTEETYTQEIMNRLQQIRNDILENHRKNKSSLCQRDTSGLSSWSPTVHEKPGELAPYGHYLLLTQAQRYKEKLFRNRPPINEDNFKFYHGEDGSGRQSAEQLLNGWTPTYSPTEFLPMVYMHNAGHLTQDSCIEDSYSYDSSDSETRLIQKLIREVSERLGFDSPLAKRELLMMYYACHMQISLQPRLQSPWCVVFTDQQLEVLEYLEDIKAYHYDGYGGENYYSACGPLEHMRDAFNLALEKRYDINYSPTAHFVVTDEHALLRFITLLGIGKDNLPIKADNFDYFQNYRRNWRTSYLAPHAGHVSFALLKCMDKYYVRTHLQERPVLMYNCSSEAQCAWSDFQQNIDLILNECRHVTHCGATTMIISHSILSFMIFITFWIK